MSDEKKFNLRLEQYKLNELKEGESNVISPEDSEYLEYIENDNNDFFNKFDIDTLVKETKEKSEKSAIITPFPSRVLKTVVAAAACFIIAFNILPGLKNDDKEIIYLKGSQQINIYLKDRDKIDKLRDMDRVFKNDQLQITYKSNNQYGVIFSVDGLNNITFHYPEEQFSSTKLDIGKEVTLPTSYTLDSAPFFEKFYLITSDKSFDFSMVRDATLDISVSNGKIVSEIKLPRKYKIDTITLLKD